MFPLLRVIASITSGNMHFKNKKQHYYLLHFLACYNCYHRGNNIAHIQDDGNVLHTKQNNTISMSAKYNLNKGLACYEASCDSSTLLFYYPSVNISGIPKADTSASYELLKEQPSIFQKNISIGSQLPASSRLGPLVTTYLPGNADGPSNQ